MSKVLIVDDDCHVVEGLLTCFELENIEAVGAYDLDTARARVANEFFPVIVADLRLQSEEDGFRLLEAIRTISPESRVATLTGYATDELERELARLGSRLVLHKPVESDVIVQVVRELLIEIERAEGAAAAIDDPAQLEDLYRSTRRLLTSIAVRRYGFDATDAEELLQEAWCLYLERQREIRAAKPWLGGTLVNLCRREIARRMRHDQADEGLDAMLLTSIKDDALVVEGAMRQLDERSRLLIRLIALEELTYDEASAATGVPVGSIGPTMIRARNKMREALRTPRAATARAH